MNDFDKKQLLRKSIVFGFSALLFILGTVVLRDWIIIGFGIRVYRVVRIVLIINVACGAAAFLLTLVKAISSAVQADRARRRELEQQQAAELSAEDSLFPDVIASHLARLFKEQPGYKQIVSSCVEQMQQMDLIQERQNRLICDNDARYLSDTETVLENVERRLCQNLRSIINLCIAADPATINMQKVQEYLDDNTQKLQSADKLVKVSVDWINQYNSDRVSDRSEVEFWIETIRESLKEDQVNEGLY